MNDKENMTRSEALSAAGESFLHVERISHTAQGTFAADDPATFYIADALGSLAYGLKLLAIVMADENLAD